MAEYILVSAATLGSWFADLMPSRDQILDHWIYLAIGVLILIGILFLGK